MVILSMQKNKTVIITGSARRLGKEIAISLAKAGYSLVIHSTCESEDSKKTLSEVKGLGVDAKYIAADFSDPIKANQLFLEIFNSDNSIFSLINNAAIFEGGNLLETNFVEWQNNFSINLSVPFLLSQSFAKFLGKKHGRIINILDWRALRPGKDHFAYTISKAALASMTRAMALALAPNVAVNGVALGAILPPADGGNIDSIITPVPAARWAEIKEVTDTIKFLLSGPEYITGEIIHVDGGRHLV